MTTTLDRLDELMIDFGVVGRSEVSGITDPLQIALDTASTATRHIKSEQARLKELLDEATNDVEIAAREFQIEYVEGYLTRAEQLAIARLEKFSSLTDPAAEKERVKNDIEYWFKYYAWGYDPRARTPLSVVPFELYPIQKGLVEWLDDLVFRKRTSGVVEKARDEGATETIARWGLYQWLFNDGFSMLLSTRKEDEVDSKKNQNTLFERLRFQMRLLPTWMLPQDFSTEKDMLGTMLLANPENGNTMLGEAPVENMGRGGRVTCAMLDEFAFWRYAGYPQFRSLSQTTDSIIMPSSVAGRLNQYADIAFDGITSKFVMDWRDNPFKDKRWYDALPFGYISPKMTSTSIAQEVDRDYDAAQPGKVWKYDEAQLFITVSEFLKPFKEAGKEDRFTDERGGFRIPQDWTVQRCSDYGQTKGHDWSYGLFAQPTQYYPLNDTHFCFISRNLEPTGLTEEQAVAQWRLWEEQHGIRAGNEWINKPTASWNSHEQNELRTVLLETYGETWTAWDTDYYTGISTLQDWWTAIDKTEPNPFRPQVNGRCRLVFVAPDDEYQIAENERLNTWFVTMSQSESGFLTWRKQLSAYHYPEAELGKAVKAMRPVKEFDDIVDAVRGYAVNYLRKPKKATTQEQVTEEVHKHFPENRPKPMNKLMADSEATNKAILADKIKKQIESREAPKKSRIRRIG